MTMKAGKIWGQTELIHANGVLEFHRIEFKKGFKCSEHEHKYKWNGFFVESGKMIVRVWQEDQGLVDETILEAGDFTQLSLVRFINLKASKMALPSNCIGQNLIMTILFVVLSVQK